MVIVIIIIIIINERACTSYHTLSFTYTQLHADASLLFRMGMTDKQRLLSFHQYSAVPILLYYDVNALKYCT